MSGGRHPRIGIPWSAPSGDPEFGALGTIVSMGATGTDTMTSTLTGVTAGDLVIALLARDTQSTITGVTLAGQAMSQVKRISSDYEFKLDVYAVIASSSNASANVVGSYSASDAWGSMITARYSNVASATPLTSSCNVAACDNISATSTTRTAIQITTSERALILAVGMDFNDVRTHTAANSFTKRADGSGTPVTSIQFIFDRVADAGNFGGASNFSSTSVTDTYLSGLLAFA